MHFIYPGFLFALSALSIPVIIHLFNFRRFKKIYFTNVRFLREIKQDTKSRSQLKHLLILLARLLAVTFLVLAFAQPYIPARRQQVLTGNRRISVFVDNSFSMDAVGKNGSLIESAKRKAREIALAYKNTDQFQLLTTSFEARHQRLVSRDEFIQLLDEIKPASSVHTLSEIVARQEEALNNVQGSGQASKNAYVISDFQRSITDAEKLRIDTSMYLTFVPVEASRRNNLFIDTCYLLTPFVQLNVPNQLVVRVRNAGSALIDNVPLKLVINGVQKSVNSLSVNAGTTGETILSFTISESGWQQAQLNITDYPVTFDDNFYFSFNVRPDLKVLCINGKSPSTALDAVFGNDAYFKLYNSPAGQVDYSSLPTMQLIILNEITSFSSGMIQELKRYTEHGGTIFLIPSEDADLNSYRELSAQLLNGYFSSKTNSPDKVSKIETRHSLFNGVFESGKPIPENIDLPVVNLHYVFTSAAKSTSETVMRLQSGDPYLVASQVENGNVYVLTSSLQREAGNFPRHALFVPVMIRSALLNSFEVNPPLVIGKNHDIVISDTLVSTENVFHLSNKTLSFDIIPESRLINGKATLSVHDQVVIAENYELSAEKHLISVASFNYDRKESDLSVLTQNDLEDKISKLNNSKIGIIEAEGKELSHSISQLNEGRRLWKYCIMLTLFFLATEIMLIRLFKR
jgi:hypothetical protein